MTDGWATVEEFAELAAIVRRVATKALARAWDGHLWRGCRLEVRHVHGRGGRAGMRYEVSLKSLSDALGEPLSVAPPSPPPPGPARQLATEQGVLIGKRMAIIRPIVEHATGSAEWRAALATAMRARGAPSENTLRRWLAQYEAHGVAGLGRKRPADAGGARVFVSRQFDQAVRAAGHEPLLAEFVDAADLAIKQLWASRAEQSGWKIVGVLASELLRQACEKRGVSLPKAALKLPRSRVERFRRYSIVNTYENDRKTFTDHQPRVKRIWDGDAMEVVACDVKPLDIYIERPDGTVGTSRLIGFQCINTGRLFYRLHFPPQGEGVRQEHIIEAFLAMVADPLWGFPLSLYMDNGSEYGAMDKLGPALNLLGGDKARGIIRAQPYNASAKPIESLFASLDRYMKIMPGYVGENRTRKKTQNVGRAPEPYRAGWATFEATIASLIDLFHAEASGKRSQGKGLSPNERMQARIDAGWAPVEADALAIDSAFCRFETRRVGKGAAVSLDGVSYWHPDLRGLPVGTTVNLAVPWRRGAMPLLKAPGRDWAYLEPELAIPNSFREGARASAQAKRRHVRAVTTLRREVGLADPVEAALSASAQARPVVPSGRRGTRLDSGSTFAELGAGRVAATATADAERDAAAREAERERIRQQMVIDAYDWGTTRAA